MAAAPSGVQEMETLTQADALLKQLGLKGSLFGAAGHPSRVPSVEELVAAAEADDEDDGSASSGKAIST
jgi:hypothetical protein